MNTNENVPGYTKLYLDKEDLIINPNFMKGKRIHNKKKDIYGTILNLQIAGIEEIDKKKEEDYTKNFGKLYFSIKLDEPTKSGLTTTRWWLSNSNIERLELQDKKADYIFHNDYTYPIKSKYIVSLNKEYQEKNNILKK